MRRLIGLALAAVALGALALPIQAGAQPSTVRVDYGGAVRSSPGGWHILDDAAHTPDNLLDVTCYTSGTYNGWLRIDFTPAVEAPKIVMTADETWAGVYTPGPSVGTSFMYVRIRNHAGAVVSCASSALATPNGNFWVVGYGYVAAD